MTGWEIAGAVALKGVIIALLARYGVWDYDAAVQRHKDRRRLLLAYEQWRKDAGTARSTESTGPLTPRHIGSGSGDDVR